MPDADHLGEIDDNGLKRLVLDHDVELVEITVDQTDPSESNDHLHQFRLQESWRYVGGQFRDLTAMHDQILLVCIATSSDVTSDLQRESFHKRHDDTMPSLIKRLRYWKPVLV